MCPEVVPQLQLHGSPHNGYFAQHWATVDFREDKVESRVEPSDTREQDLHDLTADCTVLNAERKTMLAKWSSDCYGRAR